MEVAHCVCVCMCVKREREREIQEENAQENTFMKWMFSLLFKLEFLD